MRLLRNKKQIALSSLPGMYAGDDPAQAIFEQSTRLHVEKNHWKALAFVLGVISVGAIWTRQPAPSVVKAYGVSADAGGHAVVRTLTAYKPDDQAIRTTLKEAVEHWFTIEPVFTNTLEESRLVRNINAVKAQMVGNARNQFNDWLKTDAPFQAITANPRLVREPRVVSVSLLNDSTAIVEFITSTTQDPNAKPVRQKFALTLRYQIVPASADDAIGANPFGIFFPYFTLQATQ